MLTRLDSYTQIFFYAAIQILILYYLSYILNMFFVNNSYHTFMHLFNFHFKQSQREIVDEKSRFDSECALRLIIF